MSVEFDASFEFAVEQVALVHEKDNHDLRKIIMSVRGQGSDIARQGDLR